MKGHNLKLAISAEGCIVLPGQRRPGRGEAADAARCPVEAGWEYKCISRPGQLVPIVEPFGLGEDREGALDDRRDGGTKRTGSMVSAAVGEYYRRTGRKTVAVSASRGGSSTEQWLNVLLEDALDRVDRTMEFLKSREISVDRRFLIWCQGETDADHMVSAEEYIRRTEKIIQGFLEHGIGKCFLVQIGHYNDPAAADDSGEVAGEEKDQYYRVIRDAQLRLCLDRKEVVLAASFEPYLHEMKDRFHYRQKAYNEVGLHVGRKLARSQYR